MLEIRINDTKLNQEVRIKNASRAFIIKDNKVAILYSRKYDAYITPGGGVDANESLEDACVREAKEETGFLVKPVKQVAILDCNYPRIRIIHNYFICDVVEESTNTSRTEHEIDQDLEVRWLNYKEVKDAFSTHTESDKYDIWMQREYVVLAALREYLK